MPDETQDFCTAHLERTGTRVREFRLGLCLDCFTGHAINPEETLYLSESESEKIRIYNRRYREAHRTHLIAYARSYRSKKRRNG